VIHHVIIAGQWNMLPGHTHSPTLPAFSKCMKHFVWKLINQSDTNITH